MDLSTTYMGLKLKNPLVPSASPLSYQIDTIKKLEDAGAAAIVLYSVFEEQILFETSKISHFLVRGAESFAEAVTYFPHEENYKTGPEEYLEHIQKAKKAVSIPIMASINCVSLGGWTDYAKKIQQAGADGLELNVYFIPTDITLNSEKIEKIYLEVAHEVKKAISIPVAVKLSPYFTNMARMIKDLDNIGINGLVLFNRFYQPDLDLEELAVEPGVELSTSGDLRLPLRWIAIMYGKIRASMAGTSGVHTPQDAIKLLMAGADVANMCAALLKHGPFYLPKMLQGIKDYMKKKEYDSVSQLKGILSQKSVPEPAAFERANYMKALTGYSPSPTW
jgi:dihydroorotate dehydrogenase (fumarate)